MASAVDVVEGSKDETANPLVVSSGAPEKWTFAAWRRVDVTDYGL